VLQPRVADLMAQQEEQHTRTVVALQPAIVDGIVLFVLLFMFIRSRD
jgi:hypothetical protein